MIGLFTFSLWLILGLLVGILVYFAGGFFVEPIIPASWTNSIAGHYDKTAMKLIKRAVIIERGTKFDIYRTSHDGEKNADEFTMDGKKAHVTNETGLLSTLHKQPVGLLPPPEENVACYVSPEIGEFGEIETNRKEHGEMQDNGNYQAVVDVSETRPLAQLRNYARRMIPGNRGLYDLDETVDLYKQSQRLFGSSKTTQFMILIIAYGAAMLITAVILTQAGGTVPVDGGGAGPSVPPVGGGS
jgi:hypothetical protein